MKSTPSDDRILHLLSRGLRIEMVANRLDMPVGDVRAIAARLGVTEDQPRDFHVHKMWRTDSMEDRRQFIWERQHDGAKLALKGRLG